ncbi:MAG: NUDIX hydrolase [Clostridiales bacterium]
MKFYDLLYEKALENGIEKIVVGGIVVNKDNDILILVRDKDDFMGGIHELPSGTLESGESIKDTLEREVKEETNLEINRVINYINSFDYLSGSGKKTRQFNFAVDVKNNDIKITEEHNGYSWQNINDCRDDNNITDEVKYTLEIYNFNLNLN